MGACKLHCCGAPFSLPPVHAPGCGVKAPAPVVLAPGEAAERTLYELLETHIGSEIAPGRATWTGRPWLRSYPWGAFLEPRRGFVADAALPAERILIESDGDAHGIKEKRRGDVKRRQLAVAAGWRVVSVLPEQVRSGEVVRLVQEEVARV